MFSWIYQSIRFLVGLSSVEPPQAPAPIEYETIRGEIIGMDSRERYAGIERKIEIRDMNGVKWILPWPQNLKAGFSDWRKIYGLYCEVEVAKMSLYDGRRGIFSRSGRIAFPGHPEIEPEVLIA